MFNKEKKDEIVAKLHERLQKHDNDLKCPMCANRQFTIADAYVRHDLQSDLDDIALSDLSIPSVAIICNNCGFISQHDAKVLGLLP